MSWYIPAGSTADGAVTLRISPETAGWAYSGMTVLTLSGAEIPVDLVQDEAVIVPLSARDVTVVVDDETYVLRGRDGVFAGVSDWIYVPVRSRVTISGASGEVAVCTARASDRHPVVHRSAEEVPVEVRGSGRASRQVNNIATPDSFDGAHKINVCEVITPGGNWSSWPPHRHDGIGDCTTTNEEIYYFRMGRGDSPHGDPVGEGSFHVYTVDGSVDDTETIKDADAYLVPQGYHGPTVAPPEYPMYFLNVLAGPADDRSMAFCDDPSHHWIRESWEDQTPDPRLPMTSAAGRTDNA